MGAGSGPGPVPYLTLLMKIVFSSRPLFHEQLNGSKVILMLCVSLKGQTGRGGPTLGKLQGVPLILSFLPNTLFSPIS